MARIAGKLRADLRAMEIQANDPRTNPVRGAGATPTSGLSQFRGGRVVGAGKKKSVKEILDPKLTHLSMLEKKAESHADFQRQIRRGLSHVPPASPRKVKPSDLQFHHSEAKGYKMPHTLDSVLPSEEDYIEGRGGYSSSCSDDDEVEGGAHHRTKNSASRMSDAMAMGLHLGQHLHSLHGAGFFRRFARGLHSAVIEPVKRRAKAVAEGHHPIINKAGELINKAGEFRQNVIEPIARPLLHLVPHGDKIKMALDARDTVRGLTNTFLPEGKVKRAVKAIGLGKGGNMYPSGEYEGQGRESDDVKMVKGGKKRRAPAKDGDGRKKRAEIVKKVMREKGMKMIEASKYVKAHSLY